MKIFVIENGTNNVEYFGNYNNKLEAQVEWAQGEKFQEKLIYERHIVFYIEEELLELLSKIILTMKDSLHL